jgi:deazaflavin-dependent oxidoreductase (nitroreductase family)
VVYLPDGADLVLVASNWGQRHHPSWSSNLLAEPHASVEISGRRRTMVARLATSEERARLWPKLVEEFPPYQTYANRGGRELRIFVLSSEPNDAVA